MMRVKRIIAILLSLCILMPFASALSDGAQTPVRVGWFPHPGGQESHDGAYSGYDYDYLMEIAQYTGWEYTFVEASFSECSEMLKNGEIDILGSLFYNEERAKVFDFPQLPLGHTYTTLFTAETSEIQPYDFARFDGMRIGFVSDAVNKDYLATFALENGFGCETVGFDGVESLTAAVLEGGVDAGILGGYIPTEETRILAEFAPLPYYLATTKGNERILIGLNRALNRIKIDNPHLETELREKYFSKPVSVSLTAAELALVKETQKTPVTVGIIPDSPPASYYSRARGKYIGIHLDMLAALTEKTGLQFAYAPLDLSKGNPVGQIRTGAPQIVAGILKTPNFEEDESLLLSDPIFTDSIAIVGRMGENFAEEPAAKTFAIMEGFQVAFEYAAAQFPKHRVVTYKSFAGCMDAVRDGRADATIYTESCINYMLQNPHYEKLERNPAFSRDVDICIVGLSADSALLISVINKGLAMISDNERNGMIIEYTVMNPYQLTVSDVFYKYRTPLAIIAILVAIIITALILLVEFRRRSGMKLQRAYEQEKAALAVAEKASAAKGAFMSRMSHEIRTPLNAVIGYNSIALNEMSCARSDEELRQANMKVMDCLTKSDIASKHLLTIINDVLDMSAIESGNIRVAHERFDFRNMVSSLTALFFSQASAKEIDFKVVLDALTDEWFVGDFMRVNQILTNLLSNAIKFTPTGGSVTLTIRQTEADAAARMHFEVSDTGIGMDEEYLTHIWAPFEQADSSISRRFGGTGLGLAITKNLVDLMGGTIRVESEPNVGTTFFVELCFDRAEPANALQEYNFSGIHALVVDDDPSTCEYIKLLFDRCGARCRTATSGKEALAAVKAAIESGDGFTLCMIDWHMPRLDGIETVRRLRRIAGGDIPAIIVTAYDSTAAEIEAATAGVNMIVSKPLFQSTLFDLLANVSGMRPAAKQEASALFDFTGSRVLLAEDNAMNMEIAKRILLSSGLEVDCAWNGEEALNLFAASPKGTYQAVLMDVQMPKMNGYDATRAIRAAAHPDAAGIPIIAMTADAFAENVAEALAAGMNDHIAKPVSVQTLFETLQKHFHRE